MPDQQIPADDWTDQDLLTRDEAAIRLRADAEEAEAELAGLNPDDPATERLRTRVTALRSALSDLEPSASD